MMKKHKKLKVFGLVILTIVTFFLVINIVPPKKSNDVNPFISTTGKPMISAHRGGADNNPENTMKAFKAAVNEYKVDILESDLYLTKDGYLVYNHDSYIDETCNVNGNISLDEVEDLPKDKRHYIENMTLEELRTYNFGYYYEENGTRLYKDVVDIKAEDLQITEAEELFKTFYESNPDLLFIIEIKNSGERGYKAFDTLNEILSRYPNYKDQIVIGTFHDEIEDYIKENYPEYYRGAPTGTAAKFIVTQLLKVNIFDNGDFDCLQIPMEFDLFEINNKDVSLKLDKKQFIRRAHRRNIAVQYWTINKEEDMRRIIDLGADAIMTDNPKLLNEVLKDYE